MFSGSTKRLVLACFMVIATSATLIWRNPNHVPDLTATQACAVYRSFYENEVDNSRGAVFRPVSQRFKNEYGRPAPVEFSRRTTEYKFQQISPDGEVYTNPLWKEFKHDTTEYFEALLFDDGFPVHACFEGQRDHPEFYGGPTDWLYVQMNLLAKGYDRRPDEEIWTVSPVAFSGDRKHALLYAEVNCGGLCGGGAFFLFERRSNAWVLIGEQGVWVS